MKKVMLGLLSLFIVFYPAMGWAAVGDVVSSFPTSTFDATATNPVGLTFDSFTGTLWLADHGNNGSPSSQKIYNITTSGALISSFPSPNPSPNGLAFDGTDLWVSDSSSDLVWKVSTAGVALSSINPPGASPDGLAFDGTNLWVAVNGDLAIYQVDTSGNLLSTISATTFDASITYVYGVAHDGTNLWVSGLSGTTPTLYNITTTGTLITSFSIASIIGNGTPPADLAFDGTHLWLVDHPSATVYQIDIGPNNFVLAGFFNDGGKPDKLPPAQGYASFVTVVNPGANTATLSVNYRDFLGGDRTPSANTFSLTPGQGVTFRPVSVNDAQEGGAGSPGAQVPDMPVNEEDDPLTSDIKESTAFGFIIFSSDQPIVGSLRRFGHGNKQTAFALIPPSSSDFRLTGFFNDSAQPHSLPPGSGYASFISVINVSQSTATIAVSYRDTLGGDRTPSPNTFSLSPFQGVTFRPASVNDLQEGGPGSPGALVPDMPVATTDDPNTTNIRENAAWGYVLFSSDEPVVGSIGQTAANGFDSSFALAPPQ